MRLPPFATIALIGFFAPGLAFAQEPPQQASAEAPDPVDPGPPDLDGGSSYGLFLAGRAAMTGGDGRTAVGFLQGSLAESGGELILREAVFSAAILAGDIRAASQAGLVAGESNPTLVEAQSLAQITQALAEGRSREVYRVIRERPIQAPHQLAGRLIDRWLAADARDWDVALAPVPETADALTRVVTGYYRALLLEHRRDFAEADAQYRAMLVDGTAAAMTRLPYGEFLERRRRYGDAIAVYDAGLARGADSGLEAARARAASRGRPPSLMSIRQGAALAFSHSAGAADVSNLNEFVIAYLRMSLVLAPENGEAWLILGEALNDIGMPLTAREAWARTPQGSAEYTAAQIRIAASLDEAGETEAAARLARQVADQAPGPASAFTLAALLSSHEQYGEALAVLNSPSVVAVENWNLEFLRGAAHERRGEHQLAEDAFQRALGLSPGQPEILNYLGYMWVDRGERVEEGLALIEQAVAAEPDNGNYQDSLGWARYRQGRFEEAVTILERAVSVEPGSAVINDHLGDAYWQVDRRREAEFQWRRALTLDPTEAERAAIEVKLAGHAPSGAESARP